jgi:sterol 14alpha-demethylase
MQSQPHSWSRGLRRPPRLSGGLPIVGHTIEFVRSTIGLLERAQSELGEIAALRVATKNMVAVFGPEAHEAVFRAKDSQLNPAEAYQIMTPVFGKDVAYDAPPGKMAEQLMMLVPALKDWRLRTYVETVVEETERAISSWGDSGQINLLEFTRVLTNFTSSRCLLGEDFRGGMTSEFAEVYHDLERGVTPLSYLNANLPIPSFRRRDRARVRMQEMITSCITSRRREGRQGEDFLQTLMEARYADGKALSEHEITGMILAAMFAGHHTSSVTTAWTVIELLQDPAYFGRVVAQIDGAFGEGQPVTFQSLRDISLTEYAVKEALRLHPPLFMLVRVAMEDFVYKDYLIPRGTWVLVSPTVSHRIGSFFADPQRFDPERFAPPREEDKRSFAYIPFGGGGHRCLGSVFALLQIKAILAILLRHYELQSVGDPVASDFHGLVIGPREPYRVRYRRRRSKPVVVSRSEIATPADPAAPAEKDVAGCPFHAGAATVATPHLSLQTDRALCQGHAVCVGDAPELFALGADGKVRLLHEQPPAALADKARLAVSHCPTGALRIVEG